MNISRAVILLGSAKRAGTSTSEALARYLAPRLGSSGAAVATIPAASTQTGAGAARFLAAVADADLLILVAPVYVDSLPYLVTRALEGLAAERRDVRRVRRTALAAIVNCGFPEAQQCQTAIDIARAFARRAGFEWAGGLALGEGGMIDGRPIDKMGAARHVRAALDLAAAALAAGVPIPDRAVSLMGRRLIPASLYALVGGIGFKRQARRHGVRRQLRARPFEAP